MPSKSKTKGNTFERLIVNKAKEKGFKPFWVNIWEENKYVKLFYAKDKPTLDELIDEIDDDYADNMDGWEWKKANTEIVVFE